MTFESRSKFLGPDNGVDAVSIQSTIGAIFGTIEVSRNTRTSLVAAQGYIADAEDGLEGDNRCVIALIQFSSADGTVPPFVDSKKVFTIGMARSIVGTPANMTILASGVEIDKNLAGLANTSIQHTGTRSNTPTGWTFVGVSSAGNYSILAGITVSFVDEWLNGSGSKKDWPDWLEDNNDI